eukprot:m51a1_g3431 putative snf7 family protein (201) ;mRNA; f:626754-627855
MSDALENQLFQLRFTSKQLQRESVKCESNTKKERLKVKKAIEQGNVEGARIYAQNAIREKNQALNYLRLASRIDGVASRVNTAIRMRTVTKSMSSIVKSLEKSSKAMDLEKVTMIMDQFEKQFENLDVQSEYVQNAMSQSSALSTPASEVDSLIQQVADEHGLELAGKMGDAPMAAPAAAAPVDEQDELAARLERLKQKS